MLIPMSMKGWDESRIIPHSRNSIQYLETFQISTSMFFGVYYLIFLGISFPEMFKLLQLSCGTPSPLACSQSIPRSEFSFDL